MDHPESGAFMGTSRFVLQRRLGEGGFGVVYEAHDRERNAIVALKALRGVHADSIYRFKQEFRTLADLIHPNLVILYELLSEAGHWFFTMELVNGVDWVDHVRQQRRGLVVGERENTRTLEIDHDAPTAPSPEEASAWPVPARMMPLAPGQELVLRGLLRQTVEGLIALHAAGKLHRDIKPSNVLVNRQGRVVILDFGLATELAAAGVVRPEAVSGTPHYMSPEQADGELASERSDWYSVGVMLYEALTGRLPFMGTPRDVLAQKLDQEPPPPSVLAPGTPPDLDALCSNLLRRDPAARPNGADILARLGAPPPAEPRRRADASRSAPLVGRQRHLSALGDAFARTRGGRGVTALVHGGSGMGKTALARRFVDDLRAETDVLVLSGPCYEQESVPYKALDTLMDALSQHLLQLSPAAAQEVLPRDVAALGRLFPVLHRVGAIGRTQGPAYDIADPQELRRRAFAGLRELFSRVAARRPVVLLVDDLQWGDAESAALLAELVRPPEAPPLLLIACYRTEEAETSPFLRVLLPFLEGVERVDVAVEQLAPDEARDLAASLLPDGDPLPRQAEAIARESGGNPFFIDELARHPAAGGKGADRGAGPRRETTLEDVIRSRIVALPPAAQRLLEAVAVAGRPVERVVVTRAAEVEAEGPSALALLQAGRLVRTRETGARDEIEPYHDRIRETVVAALETARLGACHLRLAQALEVSDHADPETLAAHFDAAGEGARAAHYASIAGDKAAQALAFDRAARLYQLALARGGRPDERLLRVKLGDALGNAGRGRESARSYLAAVRGSSPVESLELQRRAADQLLRSGHLDEGLAVLRDVLARLGLKLPESNRLALLSLVLRRARIRLRGLRFRQRDEALIAPEKLLRIDACWSVATTLSLVDPIRAQDFQARQLLLALESGETRRVARAIACESPFLAMAGESSRPRTDALLGLAERFAEELDDAYLRGLVALTRGSTAHLQGRYPEAREKLARADAILRERCSGVVWERDTNNTFWLTCLLFLGEISELCRRLPALVKEALDRGDLFAASQLRVRFAYISHLASDRPSTAHREVDDAMEAWPSARFGLLQYWALYARTEIALYSREGPAARMALLAQWAAVRQTRILRIEILRLRSLHLRARCALAAATEGGAREPLLQEAEADARRLEAENATAAGAFAALVHAGIAATRGRSEQAVAQLVRAEAVFASQAMGLLAAVARYRRGELLGDAALVGAARDWMSAQGIRNAAGMADTLVTGAFKPPRSS